jgi:ABC-type branched-subunit amino acid transport system substrate-binding protein
MLRVIVIIVFCLIFSIKLQSAEIKIGMSVALTGPTKKLGIELKRGASLFFSQYNKTPTGKKHPISLIVYDDSYEPEKTVHNTKKLIANDKVFALFSFLGTPTSKAIMPIIKNEKLLYFSPFTGAEFLRNPVTKNIFNIRTSYFKEAQKQIDYFIHQQKLTKVALFIQADEFGLSASKGYLKALSDTGINVVQQVRYRRNTSEVKSAVDNLIKTNPDVIFCIGTYSPIAELINQLRLKNNKSKIVMLSFAGAHFLHTQLIDDQNVYVTSVFPSPEHSTLAIVQQYKKAMGTKALSFESLEGYINAAVFVEIIKNVFKENKILTKTLFIQHAEQLSIDLKGLPISFSQTNHQALNKSYLNKITKQGVIPMN